MKNINYFISSLKISIVLSFSTISSQAADILVNSSGLLGSYTTISAAVQAASSGDRILISSQTIAYQEDSLVIDKDLTLMPYATQSFVGFEGSIQLTLDSIANFTLIGFRGNNNFKNLFSVISDTATNSLSVVNIIDCMINNIRMDQPKTSLYLSYSEIYQLAFSHGNIIGNKLNYMYFGNFDYSSVASQSVIYSQCSGYSGQSYINCILKAPYHFWSANMQPENNLNSSFHSTECDLFADYIPFGNVNVYSDTCNIIANYFYNENSDEAPSNFFNLDFPVNYSNNFVADNGVGGSHYYLLAPTAKGTNQFINNIYYDSWHYWNLSYCPANSLFNFADISVHWLNNAGYNYFKFWAPHSGSNSANYGSLPTVNNSLMAYNTQQSCNDDQSTGATGMCDAFFSVIGQHGEMPSNSNPDGFFNPSLAHLNLDLTPNTLGVDGGSNSWFNYHGVTCSIDPNTGSWVINTASSNSTTTESLLQQLVNYNETGYSSGNQQGAFSTFNNAGKMPPGGKARITYLNLPTQIFNPSNIRVKSKAVHGN